MLIFQNILKNGHDLFRFLSTLL